MLEHLSAKFRAPPQPSLSEPRAALILNRFSHTLEVLYATDAVNVILGVTPEQFMGKSFYYCMQQRCHFEAMQCLSSAKSNDSIAYLRFWYRDPSLPDDIVEEEAMREASHSSDSEDGGALLSIPMDVNVSDNGGASSESHAAIASGSQQENDQQVPQSLQSSLGTSSSESTDFESGAAISDFDQIKGSSSSAGGSSRIRRPRLEHTIGPAAVPIEPLEIEAVVSCTSDGLVVVLRQARPVIPDLQKPASQFANGLYAAPWGDNPIRPHTYQPNRQKPFYHRFDAPIIPAGGPPMDEFMNSIREVAVFAWSLAGINGNIASYGRGVPCGEAQPPGGVPIWNPFAQPAPEYLPPKNQAAERWAQRDMVMGNIGEMPLQQHGYAGGGTVNLGMSHSRSGYVFQGAGNYVNNGYPNRLPSSNRYQNSYSEGHGAQARNLPAAKVPGEGPSEGSRSNKYLWY
jgi:hypothetical protein